MKEILVYGDSLSWGMIPLTRKRLPAVQRWPRVLEKKLEEMGPAARVHENCLNGRRTVWEDPFKPGRRGIDGLEQLMEIHAPLDLLIFFLGGNDLQSTHDNNAWLSAQGMAALIAAVRRAPIEPGLPEPAILVIAPPCPKDPRGPLAPKFVGAQERGKGLAVAYKDICDLTGCRFFDAGSVTGPSPLDGVHLDAEQHALLGKGLAPFVRDILNA